MKILTTTPIDTIPQSDDTGPVQVYVDNYGAIYVEQSFDTILLDPTQIPRLIAALERAKAKVTSSTAADSPAAERPPNH